MTEVSSTFSQEQHQQPQQKQQHQQNVATAAAPPPPRRPRVREVSSRFMSPIVSSSSSGDLHLPSSKCPLPKHSVSTSTELQPKHHHHHHHHHHHQNQQRSLSALRRQQEQEQEPLSSADENRLEMMRSLDTPHSKLVISMQRKPQRAAVKLFKENNGSSEDTANLRASNNGKPLNRSSSLVRSRPDTPIVHGTDRMNPRSIISTQYSQRSSTITAAAKLVQSQVSSSFSSNASDSDSDYKFPETLTENSTSSDSSETGSCSSSPIPIQKCKTRSLPECRSSMPEADQLPTMSNRLLTQRGSNSIGDSSKVSSSPFYRSLSSPISSFEQPFSSPTKSVYRSSSVLYKSHQNSVKSSSTNLPPHPSNTAVGAEARKVKKILSQQENVHALRMLHNRYLQWRYANAKAEVTMNAQTIAAESSLYGIVTKISEMRDSVKSKRADLEQLKRTIALSTILESQIPYLDDWSALEGDYSSSLLGVVKALQDASLRLPIVGNVRADVRELDGALNSASNMMETISSHFESFLPKAEEMETLVSELAAVVIRERAMIEECGDLLSKTHMLQVEECSLRGQLMQLKRRSLNQAKEE